MPETLITTVDVRFNVNGQEVEARVPPQMMLIRYLRDQLGLMGTKNGCDSGHCGACTVIVNGKAQRACLVKMGRVNGARVETIEGLAKDGELHPLQQAFIETGAVQCGFCIPGMIMSAKALVDSNTCPTREDIKKHLSLNRNLCRCTGYVKIFEAIELASDRMHGRKPAFVAPPMDAPTFGRPLVDSLAADMVTGHTKFGDDVNEPGLLHGKIKWSDYPHARICSLDVSVAEAMPGVVAVVTAK